MNYLGSFVIALLAIGFILTCQVQNLSGSRYWPSSWEDSEYDDYPIGRHGSKRYGQESPTEMMTTMQQYYDIPSMVCMDPTTAAIFLYMFLKPVPPGLMAWEKVCYQPPPKYRRIPITPGEPAATYPPSTSSPMMPPSPRPSHYIFRWG